MPARGFGLLGTASEDGVEVYDSADECYGFGTGDELVDGRLVVFSFGVPGSTEWVERFFEFFLREAIAVGWSRVVCCVGLLLIGLGNFTLVERLDGWVGWSHGDGECLDGNMNAGKVRNWWKIRLNE